MNCEHCGSSIDHALSIERERCVLELNKCYYQNDSSCAEHDVWNAAIATCIDAIDALVPSAAKKECSWPKCGCIESLKGRECRALAPHAKQEQDPGESAITLPDLTTRMYSHAGKEPQAANSPIPTERTPLDAAIKIAELERECERLRVVADQASAR